MADVVVVGSGIVGAAVAYEVARAGAAVTLVDRSLPASGATGDSFAWIGGPKGTDVPDESWPLRLRVLEEYRRLEREVSGLRVRWAGSLSWGEGPLPDSVRLRPDERLIDAAEVSRLEPNLAIPPRRALHKESDGAIDPLSTTEALVRAAEDHGARLVFSTAVTGLRVLNRQVVGVDTAEGLIPARTVMVAAGVDARALCAPLGFALPLVSSPALLLRFAGPPGLVRTLVAGPDFEVREAADGVLVVAASHNGEVDESDLSRTAHRIRRRLTAAFTGAQDLRLLSVRIGARPMPVDGLPLVGPLPGMGAVYVAVMHAGITLAPVVARLVAAEVVNGARADELAGVRLVRFS